MFASNSLDPASQAWGREVQRRIEALETLNSVDKSMARNASDGLAATLRKLSDQINGLAEAQEQILQAQGELIGQQEALTAVVDDLGVQVTRINSLVGAQVSPDRARSETLGFAIPGSLTEVTLVASPVTIPEGFSRCLIFATSTLAGRSNTRSDIFCRTRIDTPVGFTYSPRVGQSIEASGYGLTSTSRVALYTDLPPGGTITAYTLGASIVGLTANADNLASIETFTMFMR